MIIHYCEERGILKSICGEKIQPYEQTPHIILDFITCEKCLEKIKQKGNSVEKPEEQSILDL